MASLDAIVVGSGPNGLAATTTLARAGLTVRVYERNTTVGGGLRTEELNLPGFRHDVCAAVHAMAVSSGFFRRFGLTERVRFVTPSASYGHPLDGGAAALAYRDLDRTVEALGRDGAAWRALLGPLVRNADAVAQFTGSAVLQPPRHPLVAARFGLSAIAQGGPWWNLPFRGEAAPALLAGAFAHATLPLPAVAAAAAGLALATQAHARGWPLPVGGSQSIADALTADLVAHGGDEVGGTRAAIARSERTVARGRESDDPYVLVSQPSLFDSTRAPTGKHVLWAYTHVPRGSTSDRSAAIIAQIERFAPGFRDLILATAAKNAHELQQYNPNDIGGDISAGATDFRQLIARPVAAADPWRMPGRGLYLASASAAPGPAVPRPARLLRGPQRPPPRVRDTADALAGPRRRTGRPVTGGGAEA